MGNFQTIGNSINIFPKHWKSEPNTFGETPKNRSPLVYCCLRSIVFTLYTPRDRCIYFLFICLFCFCVKSFHEVFEKYIYVSSVHKLRDVEAFKRRRSNDQIVMIRDAFGRLDIYMLSKIQLRREFVCGSQAIAQPHSWKLCGKTVHRQLPRKCELCPIRAFEVRSVANLCKWRKYAHKFVRQFCMDDSSNSRRSNIVGCVGCAILRHILHPQLWIMAAGTSKFVARFCTSNSWTDQNK